MPYNTAPDGAQTFYKDWGTGRPVVFSHGWPLTSDAWDVELKLVADHGFRGIAHDRRGHGRSSQTWDGNDMDTYVADLAALIENLDLRDVVLVGHSTGGGEVVRYAAQRANGRVAKIFTAGAVPPIMLKSDANPDGLADRGLRRDPRGGPGGPLAVLQGPVRPVLRHQPRGQRDLPGRPRRLLAPGHDRRPRRRLRLRRRPSPRPTSPRT